MGRGGRCHGCRRGRRAGNEGARASAAGREGRGGARPEWQSGRRQRGGWDEEKARGDQSRLDQRQRPQLTSRTQNPRQNRTGPEGATRCRRGGRLTVLTPKGPADVTLRLRPRPSASRMSPPKTLRRGAYRGRPCQCQRHEPPAVAAGGVVVPTAGPPDAYRQRSSPLPPGGEPAHAALTVAARIPQHPPVSAMCRRCVAGLLRSFRRRSKTDLSVPFLFLMSPALLSCIFSCFPTHPPRRWRRRRSTVGLNPALQARRGPSPLNSFERDAPRLQKKPKEGVVAHRCLHPPHHDCRL